MTTAAVLSPILAEITIEARIDHVWDVLTGDATVPGWLGCMNYRRELGARFHMQPDAAKRAAGDLTGATHCDLVTLKQPHNFDFTWYVPGTPATLVKISLFPEGSGRTFVRLNHQGWEQFPAEMVQPMHDQLAAGWSAGVLPNLKRAAEA